jgi:hypothetical protein
MVARIQLLRSITPGNRPAGKMYGEPYVNFGDNQFGVFDSSNVARDLIGVPMFSPSLSYIAGAAVNYQGAFYIAKAAVPAAAWNLAQWFQPSTVITLGGQLTYFSVTQLKFVPYGGNYIRLNGVYRMLPAAGAGIFGLANTNSFVNGVAGQNLAANTTYWIFCFDNAGVLTADFRTAATHANSTTAGNEGTEILTGDDTRSLIGMCRTNASSQFLQDSQNIGVLTWFNRRPRMAQVALTANTTNVTVVPTLSEISTALRTNFLCWADGSIQFTLAGTTFNSGLSTNHTIPFDSSAQYVDGGSSFTSTGNGYSGSIGGGGAIAAPTEGWHYITLYGGVNGGTGTWVGNTNPYTTNIRCSITVNVQG